MGDDDAVNLARKRLGTTLRGKYRLDELLGIGGMAAVFRATHRNGSRVAVKVLHADLARNENVRTRFLREGYAANRVGHPGVAHVLDDDIDENGDVFLVLELLDGETLEALWMRAGKKMSLGNVLGYTDRILDVLEAAHLNGVVHRDIKPENVFVTRTGVLKVMDFGIARLLDSASMTRSGELMGTPAYMSPEQAAGRVGAIDHRSDVWSVGAMMFTLLSGEYVHGDRTSAVHVIFTATTPAPSLSRVAPEVPRHLIAIVDTALAFEPRNRWLSARAMQHAIRDAFPEHFRHVTLEATANAPDAASVKKPQLIVVSASPTLPLGTETRSDTDRKR